MEKEKIWDNSLSFSDQLLYPLLPLTEGGATCEIIETMFDHLQGEQNRDFAAIGFAFATFRLQMLEHWSDLKWLQERFCYMNDIIRESPFYQWILEEGELKGVAQGVAQMRQTIVDFVRDDFPEASSSGRRSGGNHQRSAATRTPLGQTRWCPECKASA